MLVDNETKSGNLGIILGSAIVVLIVLVLLFAANSLDDKDCKEWGVEVEDHGKVSWAPIPYTPKNREDAEYIAKNLESQDRSGRYYTAKCKEYKK